MNDPFFTEHGNEPFCTLTGRSYRVLSFRPGTLGLSAVVEVSRDGQPLFRDEVKLWTLKSRKAFEERCTGEVGITPDLCRIEDELKRYCQAAADMSARGQNLEEEITEAVTAEAHATLKDPALLFRVGSVLHSLGVVG